MIRYKNERGTLAIFSPAQFRTKFGIEYCSKLIVKRPPSKEFLAACRDWAKRQESESNKDRMADYRSKLLSGYVAPAYIAKVSARIGHGLFAQEPIPAGAMIGEYAGLLTSDWLPAGETEKLEPYLLKYPFKTRYAINAKDPGNELRFINHSATASNVRRVYPLEDWIIRVVFVAAKEIPANSQILLDYGHGYWQDQLPEAISPDGI